MNRIERLEAELEHAKLEAAYVEKKNKGEATSEDKHELRVARMEFRSLYRVPAENGAQPETVGAEADVEETE